MLRSKILKIKLLTPNLAANTTPNAKINKVKGKIPNITDSAATTTLTAVENKIPNTNYFVQKTDHNTILQQD